MSSRANSQMQSWLRKQSPDALYHVAPRLNWDNAIPTLYWIVGRPDCDRATSAAIFWASDPEHEAKRILAGEVHSDPVSNDSARLRRRILARWATDGYREAGFGARPGSGVTNSSNRYRRFVASIGKGTDPLSLPDDLFGPFDGPIPDCPAQFDPQQNVELYDLLWALGTDVGGRPGGAKRLETRAAEQKFAERIQREHARHADQRTRDVRNAWYGGALLALSLMIVLWTLLR